MMRSVVRTLFVLCVLFSMAGVPANAQSVAPDDDPSAESGGEAGQADETLSNEVPPDGDGSEGSGQGTTAIDTIHGAIGSGITGTGGWVDSFFGTEQGEAENNKSRVRVRIGGFAEEGSDPGYRLKVKARLALPNTGKRLSLVVGGDGDDDSDLENTNNDEARENFNSTDSENAAVGLQYFLTNTKKSNLSALVGLRIKTSGPVGVFGTRYRHTLGIGEHWDLRFTQQAVWLTDNGFALPTRFDLDRPITDDVMSRTTLKGGWYESSKGYFYEASQSIIQRIDDTRGVRYSWTNQFQTSPRNRLQETNLRIDYRQQVWRKWLIFEIAPQVTLPRDRDFKVTPGIYSGFEIRFGG